MGGLQSSGLISAVNGQPDSGAAWVRRSDTMLEPGGQPVMVAGLKAYQSVLAINLKRGRALQNEYPFIVFLLIPEVGRACLTERDNALDAQAGDLQQVIEGF